MGESLTRRGHAAAFQCDLELFPSHRVTLLEGTGDNAHAAIEVALSEAQLPIASRALLNDAPGTEARDPARVFGRYELPRSPQRVGAHHAALFERSLDHGVRGTTLETQREPPRGSGVVLSLNRGEPSHQLCGRCVLLVGDLLGGKAPGEQHGRGTLGHLASSRQWGAPFPRRPDKKG